MGSSDCSAKREHVAAQKHSIFNALIAKVTHGSAQLKRNLRAGPPKFSSRKFLPEQPQGFGVVDVGRETEGEETTPGGKGS
jgi:hypothetical protein